MNSIKSIMKRIQKSVRRKVAYAVFDDLEFVRAKKALEAAKRTLHQLQSCGENVTTEGVLTITDPKSAAIGHHVRIGENVCTLKRKAVWSSVKIPISTATYPSLRCTQTL